MYYTYYYKDLMKALHICLRLLEEKINRNLNLEYARVVGTIHQDSDAMATKLNDIVLYFFIIQANFVRL